MSFNAVNYFKKIDWYEYVILPIRLGTIFFTISYIENNVRNGFLNCCASICECYVMEQTNVLRNYNTKLSLVLEIPYLIRKCNSNTDSQGLHVEWALP